MPTVTPCELPQTALLRKYKNGVGYADCYVAEVDGIVAQQDFIHAFYTTALFKVERALLKWFAGHPSTDLEARGLAAGTNCLACIVCTRAGFSWQQRLAYCAAQNAALRMPLTPSAAEAKQRVLLAIAERVSSNWRSSP
jgi:hypothetical protein